MKKEPSYEADLQDVLNIMEKKMQILKTVRGTIDGFHDFFYGVAEGGTRYKTNFKEVYKRPYKYDSSDV